MSGEVKPTRPRRTLFRWILFAVIGAVVGVSTLILASFLYPPLYLFLFPLYVFLSPASEFKHYYDKCMEIRRGQTEEEVLAIMTEYRIASQTPTSLVFNTKRFSADLCSVHFSEESTPHVVSVNFEPD